MSKTLQQTKSTRMPSAAANIADLLHQLGDVPPERVRLDPPPGLATKKDLLRLLDHENIPCELVNGTLVEKGMGHIESELGCLLIFYLHQFLAKHDLGRVYGADAPHELRKQLIRMPDVAFVSYSRIPAGEARAKPVATWVPDIAVEILSKSNRRREMEMKRREYFDAGVRLVWIVDPQKRTVGVYTSFEDFTVLDENRLLDEGDVLPGFQVSIRDWFAKVD